MTLRKEKERDIYLKQDNKVFHGLEEGTVYVVEVVEDDEAEANRGDKVVYKALNSNETKKTTQKDLLT